MGVRGVAEYLGRSNQWLVRKLQCETARRSMARINSDSENGDKAQQQARLMGLLIEGETR
jgi:hypothetical protein